MAKNIFLSFRSHGSAQWAGGLICGMTQKNIIQSVALSHSEKSGVGTNFLDALAPKYVRFAGGKAHMKRDFALSAMTFFRRNDGGGDPKLLSRSNWRSLPVAGLTSNTWPLESEETVFALASYLAENRAEQQAAGLII
ncbi:MAG: hypothetical protein ACLFQG_04840 [Desulfovermiculus sp.]